MDDPERSGILAFAYCMGEFQTRDLGQVYEPLSTTPAGKVLFQIGVGRKARKEITELLAAVLEANPSVVHLSGGTYSRAGRLQSMLKDDKAVVSEAARKWFARIPPELVRIVIECGRNILNGPDSSWAVVGLPEDVRAAKADYQPVIANIETAACNRGCGHCSNMATERLANISFDGMIRGFEILPPSADGVCFAYGEPFGLTDIYQGKRVNLGHAVGYLLEKFPDMKRVRIVTSGINFADPLEAGAAEVLSGIRDEWKQRVMFAVSLSDYPHFGLRGKAEAARKVQLDTVRFVLENGFWLWFNSFLEPKQSVSEIVMPLCDGLFPRLDPDEIKMFSLEPFIRTKVDLRGRAGARARRYSPDAPAPIDIGQCLAFPGIRLPPGIKKDELMAMESFPVQVRLTLSPGGFLGPGCCEDQSHFGVISDIGKPYQQIKDDTAAFMKRIERMRAGKKLTCMSCVGATHHIRDEDRFKRCVGPANAKLVPASKLRIR